MNWSEFLLFLLNWDWFDLIRAIYSSVSCPNFCCHSCTTLIKVAWIRVGKISKHEVYNMKELRKSNKWHETLKCSNQFKKTQNQLKQIESWSGYFFLPTVVWLLRNLLELCYSVYYFVVGILDKLEWIISSEWRWCKWWFCQRRSWTFWHFFVS